PGAEPGLRLRQAIRGLRHDRQRTRRRHHGQHLPSRPGRCGMSGQGKRLMLVEDEALLLMLVGDALEDTGYEVSRMSSGLQALEALDGAEQPDVVVTDVSMPEGVSGIDIAGRALAAKPAPRVV